MFACGELKETAAGKFLPTLTLEFVEWDTIPLENETRIEGTDFYFHQQDQSGYLFLHTSSSFTRIDMYNFSEKKFLKRIHLSKDGPNGLGTPPSGLLVKSPDTLYLFFNLGQRLVSINGDGEIIENFGSIRKMYEEEKYPYVEVSAVQPAIIQDDIIRFCTYQAEGLHEYGGGLYDLTDRRFSYFKRLPYIYQEGWWAGVVYDRYYHTLNYKQGIYAWSYGNDHFIYTKSKEGERKYFAASKFLADRLKPYKKEKGNFMQEELNLYRHAALQGGYSAIKYDSWQKFYYRFVIYPVPSNEYRSPSDTWKKMGIIILDENFNYRGEFLIPERFSWYQSFIGPEGIYFLDRLSLTKSENEAVFACFKVKNQLPEGTNQSPDCTVKN
ncbi:MAG: DUF4221 domain-containing protein [Cyclobacteriaceae bacterium]|nr:DUF4221 domain-containing protein [Cyclobacteriaceae bacterium]MCX7637067.1 DUF4221 domain-containing protein [Cyclobacteriaceae bacterium]